MMYGKIRAIHRYAALASLPALGIYLVTGILMAHRTWLPALSNGVLMKLHRTAGFGHSSAWFNWWGAVVFMMSAAILILGVSGLYLWFRQNQGSRAGWIIVAVGLGFPLVLILSMRQ